MPIHNSDQATRITGFSAIVAICTYITQQFSELFWIFVLFMLIDYATGLLAAFILNQQSSKKGLRGFLKKVGYVILVLFAFLVDYAVFCISRDTGLNLNVNSKLSFGVVTLIILIGNEGVSISENFGRMGINFPQVLLKLFHRAKCIEDEISNDIDNDDKK